MENKWVENDSLRVMTSKFNAVVDELSSLKTSSSEVNEATNRRLSKLIESIGKELEKRLTQVTKADVGLSNVDNTADLDKPVSDAVKQALDEATEQMVTSEEADKQEILTGHNPDVSPPIKTYIKERIQELAAKDGAVSYEIATNKVAGVVRASDDVEVDNKSGAMSVPRLNELSEVLSAITSELEVINRNLGIERERINNFSSLSEGSTTGDTELADIRIGYNGNTYSSAGEAIRSQLTDLNDSIVEAKKNLGKGLRSLSEKYIDVADIKDSETLVSSTWSSAKIKSELDNLKANLPTTLVFHDNALDKDFKLIVTNGSLELSAVD